MARVYISSTFSDLKEHREAAYHALRELRHDVIAMEDYVASDERPVQRCVADVAACDLYVGIFAWRYGYIPAEQNPTKCSITELEYRKAIEAGKPRLIFLLAGDAAWPVPRLDAITGDGERGQRIAQLRAELGTERLVSFFTTPEGLARKVSVAIQQQIGRTLIEFARFSEHMRRFAGATEENAEKRYVPLRLQIVSRRPVDEGRVQDETRVGTWEKLVTYPTSLLLVGEPGSGKTTTLLYEVQRLARKAQTSSNAALPIYLKLAGFVGKDVPDLLRCAAKSANLPPAELLDLWERKTRPIYLFLDGAEEVGDVERLVGAIRSLVENQTSAFHSLVIGCRAGAPFLEKAASNPSLPTALMLSLGDRHIDEFLEHYEATALKQALSSRLRETIHKPDLLSALAQAAPEMPAENLPRTPGGIYQLLIDRLFRQGASEYDYDLIKKPVLGGLAYRLIVGKQQAFALEDALYDRIAEDLDAIQTRYKHRRRLMPWDWTAEGLLVELLASSVLEEMPNQPGALAFSQRLYQDFFAALYLRTNAGNVAALSATVAQDLYAWTEPLAILLGLEPSASRNILDSPALAAQPSIGQIWLENRPEVVPAPSSIVQRLDGLVAGAGAKRIVRGRLTGDARHRLQAIGPALQSGPAACGLLVALAHDEHPLVRSVAQYALLHAGETLDPSATDDPLPLLLDVSPLGGLAARSWGGGCVQIGSLEVLDIPVPADVMVTLTVDVTDFDPFEVSSEFRFLHVPPGHLAARMFDRRQQVDWVALLARFRRITVLAADLARRAEPLELLQALLPELWARATSYDQIGRLLARDLGLAWPAVDLGGAPRGDDLTEETYRQLRRLYSRVNQLRTFRLTQPSGDSPKIIVTQSVRRVTGGTVTGIIVNQIRSSDGEADEEESSRIVSVVSTQSFEEAVDDSRLLGMSIKRMAGSSRLLPLAGRIADTISVGKLSNSRLDGLAIGQLTGSSLGWRVDLTISAQKVVASRIGGVTVAEHLAAEPE
jgi:hypothetical protein